MRLVAENLACVRGGRPLFRGISFRLEAGEALLVTGPNGAGKTSLLRLVAGLLSSTEGRVTLEGTAEAVSEVSHFVGHLDAVKGALTAGENLGFMRDLFGGGGADAGSALEAMGLGALSDLPGFALSAGQRRRLALARLLVAPRPLWLLDEPTAALDANGQATLARLVREHRAGGGMVIAATHAKLDFENAREIALGGAA